jgi:putative transposase
LRKDRLERRKPTPKKGLEAEQIVTKLRQVEVLQSQGKSVAAAYKEAGLTEQSYYRYRKECGGLNVEQARKLKLLEHENGQLKKLMDDLSLEKQVLKDIAEGNL